MTGSRKVVDDSDDDDASAVKPATPTAKPKSKPYAYPLLDLESRTLANHILGTVSRKSPREKSRHRQIILRPARSGGRQLRAPARSKKPPRRLPAPRKRRGSKIPRSRHGSRRRPRLFLTTMALAETTFLLPNMRRPARATMPMSPKVIAMTMTTTSKCSRSSQPQPELREHKTRDKSRTTKTTI